MYEFFSFITNTDGINNHQKWQLSTTIDRTHGEKQHGKDEKEKEWVNNRKQQALITRRLSNRNVLKIELAKEKSERDNKNERTKLRQWHKLCTLWPSIKPYDSRRIKWQSKLNKMRCDLKRKYSTFEAKNKLIEINLRTRYLH